MYECVYAISGVDQIAERLGSQTINQKVVGSIPGCAK